MLKTRPYSSYYNLKISLFTGAVLCCILATGFYSIWLSYKNLQMKKEELDVIMTQVLEQKEELDVITTQVLEQKEELSGITTKVHEQEKELNVITTKVHEQEKELDVITTKVHEQEKELNVITTKVLEQKEELQNIDKQCQEKDRTLKNREEAVAIKENEINKKLEELKSTENQLQKHEVSLSHKEQYFNHIALYLMKNGNEVPFELYDTSALLFYAASHQSPSKILMQKLLTHPKTKFDWQDMYGRTWLHMLTTVRSYVLDNEIVDIIDELLKEGKIPASVIDIKDNNGRLAVDEVLRGCSFNYKLIKALITYGSPDNLLRNGSDFFTLNKLCFYSNFLEHSLPLIPLMLQCGANPNIKESEGKNTFENFYQSFYVEKLEKQHHIINTLLPYTINPLQILLNSPPLHEFKDCTLCRDLTFTPFQLVMAHLTGAVTEINLGILTKHKIKWTTSNGNTEAPLENSINIDNELQEKLLLLRAQIPEERALQLPVTNLWLQSTTPNHLRFIKEDKKLMLLTFLTCLKIHNTAHKIKIPKPVINIICNSSLIPEDFKEVTIENIGMQYVAKLNNLDITQAIHLGGEIIDDYNRTRN